MKPLKPTISLICFVILLFSFTQAASAEVVFGENMRVDDTSDVDSSYQQSPAIATDINGYIYVVWDDDRDSGRSDIYFAKSIDGGKTFTPNKRVDDSGAPSASLQTSPAIAVTADGNNIYVVWQDYRNNNYDIYFAQSTDGGANFSSDIKVNDPTSTGHQAIPSIAVDTDGIIYVVWQDDRNGFGNKDIYFAKSIDGGATFMSPNVRVDDTGTSTSLQTGPSIAVAPNGNIYVVWQDKREGNYDIYFTKSTDGGVSFSNPNIRVDNTGMSPTWQMYPAIATDTAGNIYVVWQDERNENHDIYFVKSTNEGNSFSESNMCVNDAASLGSAQELPSIAVAPNGNIYVTWSDYRNDNWDIYFAKSNDGGTSFTDPNIRVDDTGDLDTSYQYGSSIATNTNYDAYVVWQDKRKGDYDIYFAKGREQGTGEDLILTVPYCEKTIYGSSSASSEMLLDYIRDGVSVSGGEAAAAEEETGLTQEAIYAYGHPYNYSQNQSLSEMDPQAIDYALGHFDPYDTYDPTGQGDPWKAYNFSISDFEPTPEGFSEYIRDIVHWIAYPVTIDYWWLAGDLVAHPNTPAIVPAYGSYEHWVAIHGFSASENPCPEPYTNPWYTPDFTVNGLWLSDPVTPGIGSHVYVTAQELETYLLPVTSLDRHNGKYLQVAEPPQEQSTAQIELAPPNINEETLKLKETASVASAEEEEADYASSQKEEADYASADTVASVSLDWTKIVDPALLRDPEFTAALYGAWPRKYAKVRRADKDNSRYYLVPFDKYVDGRRLTPLALIVNTDDGSFQQASWTNQPKEFNLLSKSQAINLILKRTKKDYKKYELSPPPGTEPISKKIAAELIWQPKGLTTSPFYPYWQVTLANKVYYVKQDGTVIPPTSSPEPPSPPTYPPTLPPPTTPPPAYPPPTTLPPATPPPTTPPPPTYPPSTTPPPYYY